MKTYNLRDVLPPRVNIKKDGNKLIISGTDELMQGNHNFTFTSVFDFERTENNCFVKETDDVEETLETIRTYLTEQKFEFVGDSACQKIIDKLDRRKTDFQYARERGLTVKSIKALHIKIPHFVKSRRLKDYQLLPVQHMLEVTNAANFSIPGSGKTTMTYAAYDKLKSDSNIDQLFVVGPLSSFKPWEEEFTNCFGLPYDKNVLRYAGTPTQRAALIKHFDDYEVVLTSIPIANNDSKVLEENLFHNKKIMLVLDESHHIKSFAENAAYANAMIDIGKFAEKRIILTGTPMPHSWPDLWSQITFLYPDEHVLGSRPHYKSTTERIDATQHISDTINFLWTRVTHKQMQNDLPKMNSKIYKVPMSPIQNEIYRALENDWATIMNEESDIGIYEMSKLKRAKILRLMQCVTNPGTITQKDIEFDLEPYDTDNVAIIEKLENYKEVPNKMQKAAALAIDLAEQGKNVIIWAVFRYNVKYLCDLLAEMNPIGITGEIPTDTNDIKEIIGRDQLIQTFKNNTGKIMIATLGSIAESVSLHRNEKGEPVCQNAIYLEKSFNAGQFMQSLFRLYRIGSPLEMPVSNIFLSSTFSDRYTRTIDNEIHERLIQRTAKMFRLMNDEVKLTPMNIDANSYTIDGKSQFYDEIERLDMIYSKITKMIQKHQSGNKI